MHQGGPDKPEAVFAGALKDPCSGSLLGLQRCRGILSILEETCSQSVGTTVSQKIKFMCESLLLVLASCKQRQGSSSRHVQGSCKRALEVGPGKGLVLSVVLKLRAMTEEPPVPWPGMAVAEMGGTGSEVARLVLHQECILKSKLSLHCWSP